MVTMEADEASSTVTTQCVKSSISPKRPIRGSTGDHLYMVIFAVMFCTANK